LRASEEEMEEEEEEEEEEEVDDDASTDGSGCLKTRRGYNPGVELGEEAHSMTSEWPQVEATLFRETYEGNKGLGLVLDMMWEDRDRNNLHEKGKPRRPHTPTRSGGGDHSAAGDLGSDEAAVEHRTIHHLVVESVLLGRPVALAGTLMLGGVLVGVEGKPTYGLAPLDVARLIPGAGDAITVSGPGSTVRVVVQLRRPPSLADLLWLVQCNRYHEQLELEDQADAYEGDDRAKGRESMSSPRTSIDCTSPRASDSTRGSDSSAVKSGSCRKSDSDSVEIVIIRDSNASDSRESDVTLA
jgi:hypothetical protein